MLVNGSKPSSDMLKDRTKSVLSQENIKQKDSGLNQKRKIFLVGA